MESTHSFKKSIRLRTRIFLSAGLLVGVCCIASGIGWIGQSVLLANISDHENAEEVSQSVLEIDRNVQELKSQAESYIHSGADSSRRNANRLLGNIVSQIDQTRHLGISVELEDLLDEMKLHLNSFDRQLQLAAQEREIRTAIVHEQLPAKASQVIEAVGRLERANAEQENQGSSLHPREILQAFGEGRVNLLRYLINPNANQLEEALVSLKRAEADASSVTTTDAAVREQGRQLAEQLAEFRQLALRASQATRGYLYHSNVVMAGEISEFVYYSNQVKRFVETQQQKNRTARNDTARRTRRLTVFASLAALVFACVLATNLSWSIVRPVSQLTDAFRRLAGGETLTDIPGTDRGDEIGRMSRAARVFSAKNQETHDLLSQSQSLSAELSAKAKALEETNLELDNFAYVASHDLKAPLRGINSLAQWVDEDCAELLPEDSRHHLAQMRDRVKKMDALLDDLLEYSRVGRCDQKCVTINLDDVVRSVIDMCDNKGTHVQVMSPLPTVRADLTPLKQVILNLITNAIKYNDKGSDGTIKVECEDLGDEFRLTVTDNGIGIDPRYHERVFQMYQRIAPAHIEGSGMGLAIVKKQVECHGGCVTLESEVGLGCRIAFTWPNDGRDRVSECEHELLETIGGT